MAEAAGEGGFEAAAVGVAQGVETRRVVHFPQMGQFVQHYKITQLKRKKYDHIRQRDDTS